MPKMNIADPVSREVAKERIKKLRGALGLKQSEFAHLAGVTQPQASKWESRRSRHPKNFDVVKERYASLLSLLDAPAKEQEQRYQMILPSTGKIDPGKIPEPHSPIRFDLPILRRCVDHFTDSSDEALACWDELDNSLAIASKAPWRRSVLLDESDDTYSSLSFLWRLGFKRRVDEKVHGLKFIEAHERKFMETLSRSGEEEALSRVQGDCILSALDDPRIAELPVDEALPLTLGRWELSDSAKASDAIFILNEVLERCQDYDHFKKLISFSKALRDWKAIQLLRNEKKQRNFQILFDTMGGRDG